MCQTVAQKADLKDDVQHADETRTCVISDKWSHDQVHQETQRWGSAFKSNVIGEACLWDAELRVGMCGDFCKLSSAAGAISSGLAMAECLTKAFQ